MNAAKARTFSFLVVLAVIADVSLCAGAIDNSLSSVRADGAHPNYVSNLALGDSADFPTLARVWPTNNDVGVSGFCHGLLFYGLGRADLPSYPSGEIMLKVLTDEEAAIRAFGESPFVRTRNGLRYFLADDPVFHVKVGETHRDQCLATFAALDLPLSTPIYLKAAIDSISNLLTESVANFSFDQREPAWTAMAYGKYLPPRKDWTNRFGERTSFSQLVVYLLRLDPNTQSCAGTHIFQALIKIDNADRRYSILSEETRKQLSSYLDGNIREVIQCQQADGSWGWQWCKSVSRNDSGSGEVQILDHILITGHLLEMMNSLPLSRRPPASVYLHASEWLERALDSPVIRPDASLICPFTHASRAVRDIQLSSKEAHVAKALSIP